MVFYECVVTTKNSMHFHSLTALMKKISLEVVNSGGIVRAIHNHGIRELPHRTKAKFADKQGIRYHTKGRFLSIYYDCSPVVMRQVEQILNLEEDILRLTHLKARSIVDFVNFEKKNPYLQKVYQEEKKERQAIHHRNQTVEQVIEDMRSDDGA